MSSEEITTTQPSVDEYVSALDVVGTKQFIYFTAWPKQFLIKLELINFHSAKTRTHRRGHTPYTDYAALSHCHIPDLGILPGDMIGISLPFRCFRRALYGVNPNKRRECLKEKLENNNIYIEFIKKNEKTLIINEFLPSNNSEELQTRADNLLGDYKSRPEQHYES